MHACGHDAHTAMTARRRRSRWRSMRKDLPRRGHVHLPAGRGRRAAGRGRRRAADGQGRRVQGLQAGRGVRHARGQRAHGRHGRACARAARWRARIRSASSCTAAEPWRDAVEGHRSDRDRGADRDSARRPSSAASSTSTSDPAVVTFGIVRRRPALQHRAGQRPSCRARCARSTRACASRRWRVCKNIAEHVAAANGATRRDADSVSADSSNPVNYNDPALTARVRASLEKALGKDHVHRSRSAGPRRRISRNWRSATDVPSVYFFVGATPLGVGSGHRADQPFAEVLPRRRRAAGRHARRCCRRRWITCTTPTRNDRSVRRVGWATRR